MEKQEFMEKAAKMMAMAAAALFGRDDGLTAESALDEHSTKIRLREGGNYVVLSSLSPYTKNIILTMQETTMR